jgi:spore germination cell wall hydrolase CwlJ-like protein
MRGILSLTAVFVLAIISFYVMAASNIHIPPLTAEFHQLTPETKRQVECLADNIYFESAHEPVDGKIAVAFVTLNRVFHDRFPDDICGVVFEKGRNASTGKIVCQFSWYCEERPKAISKSRHLTKTNNSLYNEIRDLALYVYLNHEEMEDPSRGALFYHADYVSPGWRNMEKTNVIGRHIFYIRKDLKTT